MASPGATWLSSIPRIQLSGDDLSAPFGDAERETQLRGRPGALVEFPGWEIAAGVDAQRGLDRIRREGEQLGHRGQESEAP